MPSLEQVLGSLFCLNTGRAEALTSCAALLLVRDMQSWNLWIFLKSVGFGGLWILENLILNSEFAFLLVFGKDVYLTYVYDVNYFSLLSITLSEI